MLTQLTSFAHTDSQHLQSDFQKNLSGTEELPQNREKENKKVMGDARVACLVLETKTVLPCHITNVWDVEMWTTALSSLSFLKDQKIGPDIL